MSASRPAPQSLTSQAGAPAATPSPKEATVTELHPATKRTHVLDTSVLLSDPRAILRFAEHDVVLPVVVIT